MSDHLIDLRSDTVSRPTDAMRAAMAAAPVGDDVFGDDPTVIALEERAAELLGKEAGLFVPSGTMGNLVAMIAHVGRGTEVIAGATHHLVVDEQAGHAVIVGASARTLADRPDGTLDLEAIEDAFRDPNDAHEPLSGLIALENTHAHSMGQPLTPAYTRAVAAIASRHGVPLHLDGARLWNAVVAQRAASVTARDLADPADTVTYCLSKGLGCPVGSVVVGRHEVIARARRGRKLLGGGMRQAGIIAAAGLYAFEHLVERLAEDHENCCLLEAGLAEIPTIDLVQGPVETNILFIDVERTGKPSGQICAELEAKGVRMAAYPDPRTIRAVTHLDVTRADCQRAVDIVRRVCA